MHQQMLTVTATRRIQSTKHQATTILELNAVELANENLFIIPISEGIFLKLKFVVICKLEQNFYQIVFNFSNIFYEIQHLYVFLKEMQKVFDIDNFFNLNL